MREPITRELIAELLKKLYGAFPTRLASQNPEFTAETYKDGLRGIEGQALRAAVDLSIQNDQYFPRVARLRELAAEWSRRNRASVDAPRPSAWNFCSVCGAEARTRMITRPKLHHVEGRPEESYYLTKNDVRIPKRDLLKALQETTLVLETVESRQLYMEHRPGPHHVSFAMEDVG